MGGRGEGGEREGSVTVGKGSETGEGAGRRTTEDTTNLLL